jgi:hypothetical protein
MFKKSSYLLLVLTLFMLNSCSVDNEIDSSIDNNENLAIDASSENFRYNQSILNNSDCNSCDGKVSILTLKYTGDMAVVVKVVQQKGEVVKNSLVFPNGEFTVYGVAKKNTLSPKLFFYKNNTLNTMIHTSCSIPIGPGLVSGDFVVVSGESRNGGILCPVDVMPEEEEEEEDPIIID